MLNVIQNLILRKVEGNTMAKFIKGPYATVTEVKDALRVLEADGYPESAITIIANNEEDIRNIERGTNAEVTNEESSSLPNAEEVSFWERFAQTFTGFFVNQDVVDRNTSEPLPEGEDDTDAMIAGYRSDLEDGKVIILVEDLLNREAKLNIDATEGNPGAVKERDASPSEAMKEATLEEDSHPDIKYNEDILEEETTYTPPSEEDVIDSNEPFQVVHKDHHDPDDIPQDGVLVDEVEGTSYIDGEEGTTGDPNVIDLEDRDTRR